jgi:hypothetical protein
VADNDLLLACQRVGLFLYKFALLEHEIDERIFALLNLKDVAADVVVGLDFFKKSNLLRTVAARLAPSKDRVRVDGIFSSIAEQNNNRIMIAHCRFEPENGSVRFRRTNAKDGKVAVIDPLWSPERFEEEFKKLDDLRSKLSALKPLLIFDIGDDGTVESIRRYMWTSGSELATSVLDVSK